FRRVLFRSLRCALGKRRRRCAPGAPSRMPRGAARVDERPRVIGVGTKAEGRADDGSRECLTSAGERRTLSIEPRLARRVGGDFMTDRYIDQEETLIYGPHAAKMIRKHVVGLVSELDGALNFFANQIEAATAHMEQMLDGARSADSAIRQGKSDRISMLGQTNTLLNRFSSHLDAHPPGIVDRKVFFVEDGTVSGIGNAGPKVLRAVTRITEKLAKE